MYTKLEQIQKIDLYLDGREKKDETEMAADE